MDKPLNIWAKLVSLHPDKENINFSIKPNETNLHQVEDACKIYQDTHGDTWIKALKKSLVQVNNTWLGTGKKEMLLGGETISFCFKTAFEKKEFDYIFSLVSIEPENSLKRKKEESLDQISTAFSQVSQKIIKVENNLEQELSCTICMGIFQRCAILTPCHHSFCSLCLYKHLKNSTNCPLCKTKAAFVGRNLIVENLLELLSPSFPNLQKPQNSLSQEEKIDLRGNIVRFNDGVYVGDFVNQKKEGKGVYLYNDGEIYDGGWKNGKKDGQGTLSFLNGDIFKGKWSNDVMEPLGEIRYHDGAIYQGEIKDFEMHGKGVFKVSGEDFYDGYFNQGILEGPGKRLYPNGDEYEGNWVQGFQDGHGTLKYENGNIYTGEWKRSKREGKGVLVMVSGSKYEGDWKGDDYNGLGKYLWENGAKYEGNWLKGMRNGNGTMEYANGDIYTGEWKNGNREEGNLKLKNGDVIEGNWISDIIQPLVRIKYSNGDRYEGKINSQNFQKHGKGILTFKNGDQSNGFWENNEFIKTEKLQKSFEKKMKADEKKAKLKRYGLREKQNNV